MGITILFLSIVNAPALQVLEIKASNDNKLTNTLLTVDPARDLATLDEELYLTYRSGEDVIPPYGFPSSHHSLSDLSANVCDIEDSDVPS